MWEDKALNGSFVCQIQDNTNVHLSGMGTGGQSETWSDKPEYERTKTLFCLLFCEWHYLFTPKQEAYLSFLLKPYMVKLKGRAMCAAMSGSEQ